MPQIYVYSFLSVSLSLSVCLSVCLSVSLSFLYIYIYYYYYYYYYHYYYCLCLCVLYVYRPCWEACKISSRFESCFVLVFFRIFSFCIVQLWVLVNLKYRKKNKTKQKKTKRKKNNDLQSLTKYFRRTLFFIWNSALRQSSIFVFQEIFASVDKIFISGSTKY